MEKLKPKISKKVKKVLSSVLAATLVLGSVPASTFLGDAIQVRATAYGIMNMTGVFAGAACTEVLGRWADGGNLGLGFALLGGVIAVALFVQLSVLRPTTDNME